MKSLSLVHVLLDYDYPQVFVARDIIGVRYICMVCEETAKGPVFVCMPISSKRCDALLKGKVDLRIVYDEPEVREYYLAEPDNLNVEFQARHQVMDALPLNWLPEPGLTFDFDEVLLKAQELNSTVAYASLSVPEATGEPRIRSRKLSAFLSIYQSVLKNLARSSAKSSGKPIPKNEEPYESDVFGFSYGSFTVQIRSADPCDILGENKALVSAFQLLNEFLDVAGQPDSAMEFLSSLKGHAASSLISLLSFVSENNCQFINSWSTPGMASSNKSRIRAASAQNIIQRCRLREDLGVESLELLGIVDSADVSAGTWKILVDGVPYSGGVKEGSGINLAGITLHGRYVFRCEEKIEISLGSGRESRKLSLISLEAR
ncbi:DUF6575 domain-containing protein [Pseudomonas sp. RIT411]|uniref:DUF6575 domain-containing protein n=1 Tax=Pseudomonas sp. RIT411 TaxID=2202160 RepID=UPI0011BD8A47|nr:DUF6575 domain-containing protein [Pseudomonas sp. RIT 411]